MPDIHANWKSTNATRVRVPDVSPLSGMCPICIKECPVLCEIGKSAFRGREVLYPEPEQFGWSTAAANKDFYLDWSHIQILSTVRGAEGIEPDPDKALFPNVDITTEAGGVKLRVPMIIAALGSTAVAKNNWDGLAIGAAISGTIMTVGENVCGMDPNSKITNGKVEDSPDMKYRVETYRKFWDEKYGDIVVQTNVEDQRLGVDVYVLSKLEVNIIERKWGQGAKAIGGEVRIYDLDRAIMLKKRGYLVIPDPEDPVVQEAFKAGTIKSFERHSRVGMPNKKDFVEDVEWLREQGAKKVFLKTGSYRPEIVAFTLRCASEAKIDLLTFDGTGGGTGMSPINHMHELGVPTVYLEAIVLKCLEILKKHGKYVPDIAMAGGFVNEGQIFKAIAMSNFGDGPYVKTISMARAPITAVMKATYFSELAEKGRLPKNFADKYGDKPEKFFVTVPELQEKYGEDVVGKKDGIPWSAVGLYTYFTDKLGTGLQQLCAGVRKFKLHLINRNDLACLTEKAAKVTGLPFISDVDADKLESILLD